MSVSPWHVYSGERHGCTWQDFAWHGFPKPCIPAGWLENPAQVT